MFFMAAQSDVWLRPTPLSAASASLYVLVCKCARTFAASVAGADHTGHCSDSCSGVTTTHAARSAASISEAAQS